jgi:uncharacterized protein (TIGR03437 family)
MGGASVLINGVVAPLLSAAPGQLVLQFPYETPVDVPVLMAMTNSNSGQTFTNSIA